MPARVSCPWFVGRTTELSVLENALATVCDGGTAAVLVGGEAGIGKSRLVGELAKRASRRGADVITGGCLDLADGGAPYGPVREALTALAEALGPQDRRDVFGGDDVPSSAPPGDALTRGIARLTEHRPVVLVIEDLHWADRSTRDTVVALAAGPAVARLLLVVTYRHDDLARGHPLRHVLAELDRIERVRHVRLGPLGAADQVEQLRGIYGHQPDAELAQTIVTRSDGNPFLTEELASVAGEHELPPGLRELLLARLDQLDDAAQDVLRAAAVGGRRVEHQLLASVTGLDDRSLARSLRSAVSQHLVVADGDDYHFRHALVHEVVLDDLLPGERAALHVAFATAIESDRRGVSPADAGTLVHHWDRAGRPGRALLAAIDAGQAAEVVYALPEAQRYYDHALSIWDRGLADRDRDELAMSRAELVDRTADVASRAGDVTRAAELIAEALRDAGLAADRTRAGLLHERRGWCLLRAGRIDEALTAYGQAVDLVPDRPPTATRARVLAAHADALERADRLNEALGQAYRAVDASRVAHSPSDEGHARHTLGVTLAAHGERGAALDELEHALLLAEEGGDVADAVGIHLHVWRELAQLGRGGELVDRARSGAARARDDGLTVLAGVLDGITAAYCHQLGRWVEADELLDVTDPARLDRVVHLVVGGLLDVDRGELDRSGDRLETARAFTVGLRDGRIDGLLARGLAERAWARGHHEAVRGIVADGLERTSDPEMVARLALVALRAEVDGRSPDPGIVGAMQSRLTELERFAAARRLLPTSEVCAGIATGTGELQRLRGADDPDTWAQAVERWDALGFPIPGVHARCRLAEALAGAAGQRDAASEVLHAALATAERLAAGPWIAAVEQAGRRARLSLGERTAAVQLPTSTADGATFGITAREHEVLAVLGRGRTNRQIAETLFISEKTVRVHVSHLLAKLGASTRGEAVDIAHRHGLLEHSSEA